MKQHQCARAENQLSIQGLILYVSSNQLSDSDVYKPSSTIMKNMSLLEHVKTLKTAMPIPQKVVQTPSKLPIFKAIKKRQRTGGSEGIFVGESFCFPLIDPVNDPTPKHATSMIRGVFEQGGQIIEFHERMTQDYLKYVVVSERTDLGLLMERFKGLVKFEKVIKYEYIWQCLNKFKKLKVDDYLLYSNIGYVQTEATNNVNNVELARIKLQQEAIDQKLIRPKLSETLKDAIKPHKQIDRKGEESATNTSQNHSKKEELESQLMKQKRPQLTVQSEKQSYDSQPESQSSSLEITEEKYQQEAIQNASPESHQPQPNPDDEKCSKKPIQSSNFSLPTNSKHKPKEKYLRNKSFNSPSSQQQPSDSKQTQDSPQFQWQNKRDRRVIWYAPPKDLTSKSFSKNQQICSKLREFYEIYSYQTNNSRRCTYIRSIAQIKSHPREINTVEELRQVSNLSKSVFLKIKQLLETGHIAKLEQFPKLREIQACQGLEKVWGVGAKKAKEFYDRGIRSVADLRKHPELISKNIAIGLKYFQEFSRRIPREKVTRIFHFLKGVFLKQVLSDRMHHLEVVGSYRRGKATCGDIDLLICRHDGSVEQHLLRDFVRALEEVGFITQSLSQPRPFTGRNNSAYMGVCLFEGEHHRIDIKHYPVQQYAFALLYFTGSDIFNRQTRMAAHNMGLQLSDHGLSKKERNGINKIYKGGELPILTTQHQIFEFLGLNYCTPEQREL